MASSPNVEWLVEWARSSPGSTDVYDSAVYDTATYDGGSSSLDWHTVLGDVVSIEAQSKKDAFGRRFVTGTGSVLLNDFNGLWSLPESGFTPGDWVRIVARVMFPGGGTTSKPIGGTTWPDSTGRTWTGNGSVTLQGIPVPDTPVLYPVFYGRSNAKISTVAGGADGVKVGLVGNFADLAVFDKDPSASVGAGETTQDRMERLFTFAGLDWSAVTEYGTTKATMQATDLGNPALHEMQLTMASEGGDFAELPDGTYMVGYRDWLTEAPNATEIQWNLGTPVGVGIRDAKPTETLQLVVNNTIVQNVGGVQQEAIDSPSIARYGHRTLRRIGLISDQDSQALYLASRSVAQGSRSRPRIREVVAQVVDDDSAVFAGEVTFGDLIVVAVTSIHGHSQSYAAHCVGITHEATVEGVWTVTVALDDSSVENVDGGFWFESFSEGFALGGQNGGSG